MYFKASLCAFVFKMDVEIGIKELRITEISTIAL